MLAFEIEVIWLLIIASAVAVTVRWIRVPYTIALVITGIAVGFFDVLPNLHLTTEVVFHIFLPVLLFEAAFHLQYQELRHNAGPILILAVPGLLLAAAVTGGGLYILAGQLGIEGLTLPVAFLFGSMICATDPISVIALFRELGVSRRLANIVEGESLFNDGAAVVIFGILLEMIRGGAVSLQAGLWEFIVVVAGGTLVGITLGLLFSRLTAVIDDHLIEITLTTILAFSAFLGAEHFHFSGVISVVMAGLMVGNYGTKVGMSPTTRVSVGDFWEYAAFIVNSVIFLLIGLEVKAGHFAEYAGVVAVAVAVVLLGRTVAVGISSAVINRFFEPIGRRWRHVLIWGGLRGSLSMALALSLPSDFPGRQLILTLVFGVVAFSLLVQGLTMKPLLQQWGMAGSAPERKDFEVGLGGLLAKRKALEELGVLEDRGFITHETARRFRPGMEEEIATLREAVSEHYLGEELIRSEEADLARRRLQAAEKQAIKEAFRDGVISEETMKELIVGIDEERANIFRAKGTEDSS